MQKNCVNSRFEHTASFSSMEYNDRKIENSLSVDEVYQTKLFIGGLSWDTTKEKLRDYFSKYGEVEDCVLMTDTSSGRSRGFGFVTFKDVSAVKAVLSEKFHQLDGKIIDPKIAIPKNTKFDSKISTSPASSFFNEPSIGCFSHYNQVKKLMEGSSSEAPSTAITPSCRSRTSSKQSANLSCSGVVHSNKIFVGGIGNTTERELRNYFSKYGIITDVTIMMDKSTGRPRGFAFIGFESNSSAELTSSIRYHVIKFKQIEVKKALPKDPKNNQLNYSIYSDYAENGLVNVNTNNVNKTEMSDLKKIKLEDKISYLNDEWDFNDAFKNHSKMDDFYSMHNNITSILVEDKVKIGHNSYKNPQYPTKNDSLFLDKSVSAKNFRVRNHTWCEAVGLSSGITDDTKNNIIQLLDEIWKNT